MQKITYIDKKIPVTMRVTGYLKNFKVLNSGDLENFMLKTVKNS